MLKLTPTRLCCALMMVLAAPAFAAEPLPSDDRIKTGKLPNGVKWMWRQHANPPGKIAIWVHVDTGSLNETDEQRGLAHFIEHMGFNGTENFAPGKLIPYFESIGMQFGPDVNAHTSFDHTAYKLYLPDTTVEQVDKGLMVLSDYAFRMSMLAEEIDKERGVILSELRSGMGADQRIRDKFFERVFAGTRLGQRLPIGIKEVIEKASKADFDAYYRTWYRPERTTLMVVGDAAPDAYLPAIEKWFGQYKAPLAAQDVHGPELKPFAADRAFLLTDPEYAEGDISVYGLAAGRPPTTTVEQYRVELVDQLGAWIMGRRFSDRIRQGESSFREASARSFNFMRAAVLSVASATGEPKNWEKMLDELMVEVNRAATYGFLEPELALARKEFLSSAEDAVRKEPTVNARVLVTQMNSKVNDKEPMLSAQQELDLVQKLLPGVKLEEVSAAFKESFKPGAFSFVLTMPQKDDVKLPTEEEILAAAKAAQARKPEPPKFEERPTTLLEKEPSPGKLIEPAHDEDLDITSAWLDNGARFHHRFMDYKKDTVMVSVALAGGEIEETQANGGITTVAALILGQPATSRLKSTDVEDIMTGKNIRLGGSAQGDSFTLTLAGSPKDLEAGLQLVHALLTDGKLEQTAFDNWKEAALQQYESASRTPQFRAIEALLDLLSGGDPRRKLMDPPRIEAQSVSRSQEWFDRLRREAPIEVAVVGEMKLADLQPLIEKYVGSLPKRPRVAAGLDKLRKLNRQPGPLQRRVEVDTITPVAMVLTGFVGADAKDLPDVRALNLAALTLDSRLVKRVREELGLVYGIGAQTGPSFVYEDSGHFLSGAPCAPEKTDDVVKEVEGIFAAFADAGPTEEELANAKRQTANELDVQLKEPSYWFSQLQYLDLHKVKLDDLKKIPESYLAMSGEQVRDAFRKYYKPVRTLRVVTVPKPGTDQPDNQPADVPGKKPADKPAEKPKESPTPAHP